LVRPISAREDGYAFESAWKAPPMAGKKGNRPTMINQCQPIGAAKDGAVVPRMFMGQAAYLRSSFCAAKDSKR